MDLKNFKLNIPSLEKISADAARFTTAIFAKRLTNKGKIIILVFFVGFIFAETALFNLWLKRFKKYQVVQLTIPTAPVLPVARPSSAAQPEAENKPPQELKVAKVRDPFLNSMAETERYLSTSGRILAGVTLTGILWDPKEPTAIINGQVYKIGDSVSGKTITKITNDRVILEADGIEFLLIIWK